MNSTIVGISNDFQGRPIKIIIFSRHGDKTPDNHITDECLQRIIKDGMPGLHSGESSFPVVNTLQLGSACVRSTETAYAAAVWVLTHGGKITKHLPADPRLGSDELFRELYTPEIKEQIKANGWKNYEALVEANPTGLKQFEDGIIDAIKEMFKQMAVGDICLSVSHSPTVETIFNLFTFTIFKIKRMSIDPLDGIILVEDESRDFHAYR